MTTPTPGSESVAMEAPSETLSYVGRARAALAQVLGATPIAVDFGPDAEDSDALDVLTILVLVKGDRATAADAHDLVSVMWHMQPGADRKVVPFDDLDPRERAGLDVLTNAVQRAGRFVGRDGS